MRPATEREFLRGLGEAEDEAVRLLFNLLAAARRSILQRIGALPRDAADVWVLTQMLRAVDDASARLSGQMVTTLASASRRVIQLGAAQADAVLPVATVRLLGTFSLNPAVLASVARSRAEYVTALSDALRSDMNQRIQVAYLSGRTPREVADEVLVSGVQPVGPFHTARARANAIARTEINRISNTAIWLRAQDALTRHPDLRKRWRATNDGRTRPSHAAANGQTVGMEEDFTVGGYAASHPLDPRLPAAEVVHCRCRLQIIVPDEGAEGARIPNPGA